MTKVTFVDVMGDSVKDILKGQMAKRRAMWNRERDAAKDMKLTDVKMIRVLGQGTFGKVALVRHTVTGTMYALKRIVKAMVCDAEIGSYVENERHTMLAMDNQFVARLITSFQDTLSIYFLQELCENGELTQLLENGQALPHEAAQFYSANIVLGLKYLHENQVMFRDLKPENVLIDKDGYLKLIDFGMCKKMSLSSRTFTMCGTPEYCAPEIIYMLDSGYRQGYGFGIDVWSLGAMICIMATGISPVKGAPFDADNMLSISAACRKMRSYPMSYPGNIKNCCKNNDKVLKLCESLLHPNPDMRPGCNKNFFGSVKKNSFFKGVNWNNLSAKTTPAPPVRGWCMCVCRVLCGVRRVKWCMTSHCVLSMCHRVTRIVLQRVHCAFYNINTRSTLTRYVSTPAVCLHRIICSALPHPPPSLLRSFAPSLLHSLTPLRLRSFQLPPKKKDYAVAETSTGSLNFHDQEKEPAPDQDVSWCAKF